MILIKFKGDLNEVNSASTEVGLNWPGELPDRPLDSTGSHNFSGRQFKRMRVLLVLKIFPKN